MIFGVVMLFFRRGGSRGFLPYARHPRCHDDARSLGYCVDDHKAIARRRSSHPSRRRPVDWAWIESLSFLKISPRAAAMALFAEGTITGVVDIRRTCDKPDSGARLPWALLPLFSAFVTQFCPRSGVFGCDLGYFQMPPERMRGKRPATPVRLSLERSRRLVEYPPVMMLPIPPASFRRKQGLPKKAPRGPIRCCEPVLP